MKVSAELMSYYLCEAACEIERWTERRNQRIADARAAGWTLREIAAEVELSPEGVNKILKRSS